jgi:hypothetical protein
MYKSLEDMMRNSSGFGFDSETNMITAPAQVWDEVLAVSSFYCHIFFADHRTRLIPSTNGSEPAHFHFSRICVRWSAILLQPAAEPFTSGPKPLPTLQTRPPLTSVIQAGRGRQLPRASRAGVQLYLVVEALIVSAQSMQHAAQGVLSRAMIVTAAQSLSLSLHCPRYVGILCAWPIPD